MGRACSGGKSGSRSALGLPAPIESPDSLSPIHLMRVTTWAEYGLIVSVNLAKRAGQGPAGRGGPVAARELAEQEKLPHDYVEQILLRLRRAGLVDSVRGAKGGYHLARPPQDISVKDVIEASEHVTFEDRKSTRLNSSHVRISYAVFCLKKKKITHAQTSRVDTVACQSDTELLPHGPHLSYA